MNIYVARIIGWDCIEKEAYCASMSLSERELIRIVKEYNKEKEALYRNVEGDYSYSDWKLELSDVNHYENVIGNMAYISKINIITE